MSAAFFSSGLALASAFVLSAGLAVLFDSMLVAIILYLIVTRSPFLISPVALVSLSRAISQFSVPFLTMIWSFYVDNRAGDLVIFSQCERGAGDKRGGDE